MLNLNQQFKKLKLVLGSASTSFSLSFSSEMRFNCSYLAS